MCLYVSTHCFVKSAHKFVSGVLQSVRQKTLSTLKVFDLERPKLKEHRKKVRETKQQQSENNKQKQNYFIPP